MVDAGVDFLGVIRGHIDSDLAPSKVIPSMGPPTAPHLEFAGKVRSTVGAPVVHAARIADIATARHAVPDGLVDLVRMTTRTSPTPTWWRRYGLARKTVSGRAWARTTV